MIDCWHNFINLLSKSVTVWLVSRWWRWDEEYKNKIHTIHYLVGAIQAQPTPQHASASNQICLNDTDILFCTYFFCFLPLALVEDGRGNVNFTYITRFLPPPWKLYIYWIDTSSYVHSCYIVTTSHVWQCDSIIVDVDGLIIQLINHPTEAISYNFKIMDRSINQYIWHWKCICRKSI